ncbi:MAG: aldehyde dehydrogenase, partial [Candidatus Puniceispirillum sp.]
MSTPITIERRKAVEHLLQDRGDMLVVCGLGSSTYDVFA